MSAGFPLNTGLSGRNFLKIKVLSSPVFWSCLFLCGAVAPPQVSAQSNVNIRVMAANLNGNSQKYEPFALRIFQGLQPDVVAIQEFNYTSTNGVDVNTPTAIREMVDIGFGANFYYFREPTSGNGDLPNGIISRYPIINASNWTDTLVANRSFAWAQIALPGTNQMYVVSVHFLTTSASNRAAEAANLKTLMQANFPPNAWIVLAGDFNAGSRTESCVTTYNGYLADFPIPVDDLGNSDTSANRNAPHDYVLRSLSLTNFESPTTFPTRSYPNGLVFDSRVYTTPADLTANFAPVLLADSGNAQHMAVIKDFLIPVSGLANTNPPSITMQPQSQTNSVGASVSFNVMATGTAPLAYQWRFFGTNLNGVTTSSYSLTNVQSTNAGDYTVVITNLVGSVTSSVAKLTITTGPVITNQPLDLAVNVGENATFGVGASGGAPLNYQWRFNASDIAGATNPTYTHTNAQFADAGNYSVVVTNSSGSVTSRIAGLTVNTTPTGNIIAQWNFNSTIPDAAVGTGVTTPSIGAGTASLVTALTPTFAGGSTNDPASAGTDNSGWNTTGYPAATSGNKTAGVRFDVSTVGKQNLSVRWDQRVSNTGSKYSRLQYTTNGTTFLDFPTAVAVTGATTFEAHTNNLSLLPGVNNNASFGFRIVNEFESTATGGGASAYVPALSTSAYAGTGTTRFDLVTLFGDPIPAANPPAIAPTLNNVLIIGSQFQFLLTGTAGSNYVVQATSNLNPATWLAVRTNVAPFTFVESNVFTLPQRFYRGLVAP